MKDILQFFANKTRLEVEKGKKNTTSIYKLHLGHCPIQEDCIKHKLFQNKKNKNKLNITANHTYLQFAFNMLVEDELTRKKYKINI